jgi:hypothetical protein
MLRTTVLMDRKTASAAELVKTPLAGIRLVAVKFEISGHHAAKTPQPLQPFSRPASCEALSVVLAAATRISTSSPSFKSKALTVAAGSRTARLFPNLKTFMASLRIETVIPNTIAKFSWMFPELRDP